MFVLFAVAPGLAYHWRDRHLAAWTWGQLLALGVVLASSTLIALPLRRALRLQAPPVAARPLLSRWMRDVVLAYAALSVACVLAIPAVETSADAYADLARGILSHPWALVVPVGLLAPVAEELMFRGFGLTWLGAGGSRGWAVGVTTAAFALAHVQPFKLLPTAVMGFLLARGAWAMGSVLPGVIVHVCVNAGIVVLAAGLAGSGAMSRDAVEAPGGHWVAGAAWGAIGCVATWSAWRTLRRIECACSPGPEHGTGRVPPGGGMVEHVGAVPEPIRPAEE